MLLDEPHWGPLAWGASWSESEFVKAGGVAGGGESGHSSYLTIMSCGLWLHVVSSALLDLDRCHWRGGQCPSQLRVFTALVPKTRVTSEQVSG